jgi:hypothetical protein
MKGKWDIRTKGYLKIHVVAVNVKTKEILSMMNVTDEHIHDSKSLPGLVENIIKSLKKCQQQQANYSVMEPMKVMRFLDILGIVE